MVRNFNKKWMIDHNLLINLTVIAGGWGSSFIFVKLIGQSVPPFAFAAERGFIAMMALLAWLVVRSPRVRITERKTRFLTWADLGQMMVLGTTNGWLANVLTAVAVKYVDTAIVAMIQATVPLMVAILAHLLFADEKFKSKQLLGILVGLFGILLIIGPLAVFGSRGSLIGIAAMLLTACSYACGTVYGRYITPTDPVMLACGQQACGAIIAVVITLLIESFSLSDQSVRIWLLLAIVGTFCSALPTALYLRLLARTTSVPAALVAYLQPIWAMFLGWVVLGEQLTARALIGTGLVFVAISVSTGRQVR